MLDCSARPTPELVRSAVWQLSDIAGVIENGGKDNFEHWGILLQIRSDDLWQKFAMNCQT